MTRSHAVVLSGGGANGAYEVGVLEALLSGRATRVGAVEPAVFVGTSVGSYNAAAMVSHAMWGWPAAARQLRALWVERIAAFNGKPNGVFRSRIAAPNPARDAVDLMAAWLPRAIDLAFSSDPPTRRLLRLVDGSDVMSTEPLEGLIAETVNPTRILQSPTKLRIVTCNWDTGEAIVFANHPSDRKKASHAPFARLDLTEENAGRAILASTSIPAIFPRIPIDDKLCVDGGVVMNTPLMPAIDAGATVLHVVHLEPRLLPLPLGRAPSALESMERILLATPARLIDADIRYAALINRVSEYTKEKTQLEIHRYFPRRALDGGMLGLLDFDRARVSRLVEQGFQDAVEHDCKANSCVVPKATQKRRRVSTPSS